MHPPSHLDIDKLITDENDPKFRVLLMLVKSLSDYLAGNTEAVNDMSNKLDAHLSAFEARATRDDELRNQGRGAWRVLAWVLGGVQVIGLGIWKPLFVSLLPRTGTAIEQDHMIYGKRKNTPMDLPYFATFAHSMEIEGW